MARRRMAPTPPLEGLALILDGYFHEDFRAEHGSHEGAARAFVRDASQEEVTEARVALEAFINWADGVPREAWQEALLRAGGSWQPRTLAPLREVSAILAAPG